MGRRILLDRKLLDITIWRLCQQLIENHDDFSNSVLLGMQPRGIFLAKRISKKLTEILGKEIQLGLLDATFHRDDFRRNEQPLTPYQTDIPFVLEKKNVILIDDVLYTGRTIRAALDAMTTFGRPEKVELLVLVDRLYSRDLPIAANYIGKKVNTLSSQRVKVDLAEQGGEDNIWLINKDEND